MSKLKLTALLLGILCQIFPAQATFIYDYMATDSGIQWDNENGEIIHGTTNKLESTKDLIFPEQIKFFKPLSFTKCKYFSISLSVGFLMEKS